MTWPGIEKYARDVAANKSWADRMRRFRTFEHSVFNILKNALLYDLDADAFEVVKRQVTAALQDDMRWEMLHYTDEIDIFVSGRQSRVGWWWKRSTHKYINVQVSFSPYQMSLSAWTDPNAPGGVVCFQ